MTSWRMGVLGSITATSWPPAMSASTTWEPMKPEPPVTPSSTLASFPITDGEAVKGRSQRLEHVRRLVVCCLRRDWQANVIGADRFGPRQIAAEIRGKDRLAVTGRVVDFAAQADLELFP